MATAVHDLQEQFAHCGIDRITYKVGVQRLKQGFAGQDLCCHSGGVGHTRAADRFNKRLLDDAVLHVQGQLACALLGCTPAHTVGVCGNIGDLFCLYPLTFFGNGGGAVIAAFFYHAHVLNLKALCVRHFTYVAHVFISLF